MKKKIVTAVTTGFCVLTVACCSALCLWKSAAKPMNPTNEVVDVPEDETPLTVWGTLVTEGQDDIQVIPDKYNTGLTDESKLMIVHMPGTYQGVQYVRYNADDRLKVNVQNLLKNKDSVLIENMDFSNFQLNFTNEILDTSKTITFKNCKFGSFQCGQPDGLIRYEFENCEFQRFYGSNAHMNYCKFGGSYKDGINPFVNVTVENSFFTDMSYFLGSGTSHTDGVQVYGYKGVDVHDIVIKDCRFEIPAIPMENNKAYVNACLFLCLEFSNGDGITVDNCILNGGGFCIYTNAKDPYTLKNVSLTNLRVGEAHRYGIGFKNIMPGTATYSNIDYLDSLYAASVWKDNDGTHVSVSNDTSIERTLRVQTNLGTYDYVIDACPLYNDVVPDSLTYTDYPFDIDIVVPGNPDWIICYDVTEGEKKQIRFVNWTDEEVYTDVQNVSEGQIEECVETVISTGICGPGLLYSLTQGGELNISGNGAMYDFNSGRKAPWSIYSSLIKSVTVERGVNSLGAQAFAGCYNLESIELPQGLTNIGDLAFQNCTKMQKIDFPVTLQKIGNYCFSNTALQSVWYADSREQWGKIEVGAYNQNLFGAKFYFADDSTGTTLERKSGQCGRNAKWALYSDGTFVISGTGVTYNYNSKNRSGWYAYADDIKLVVIEEGITVIGGQTFFGCHNLAEISIPETVNSIGDSAFQSCYALKSITLPGSISYIGKFAFNGAGVTEIIYDGTEEQWENVQIGAKSGVDRMTIIYGVQ